MKKYFKTKNNIWLLLEENEKSVVGGKTSVDFGTIISKEEVLAESDNIFSLCDLFFAYDDSQNNGKPIEVPNDRIFELVGVMNMAVAAGLNCWLKGAIFTDYGLKYVCELSASERKLVLTPSYQEPGGKSEI